MKNSIEILQNTLLVFVVIMLVYVLYRRLLNILGKKKRDLKYYTLAEKIEWKGKEASIYMTLYEKTQINVAIFGEDHQVVRSVIDTNMEPGVQCVSADCSSLAIGKYYFKIVSPNQQSSLYFHLES
jgi:hypothetical protein